MFRCYRGTFWYNEEKCRLTEMTQDGWKEKLWIPAPVLLKLVDWSRGFGTWHWLHVFMWISKLMSQQWVSAGAATAPWGVFENLLRRFVRGWGCKARNIPTQQITLLPKRQIVLPIRTSGLDKPGGDVVMFHNQSCSKSLLNDKVLLLNFRVSWTRWSFFSLEAQD